MTEYDSIADSYKEMRQSVLSLPEVYSYLTLMGDLTGQTVLELGCGEGFYSRKFKRHGAQQVLGIDLSAKMIDLAKQEEARNPLGIEYWVRDVLELGKVGEFDLVTATFLLNHAQTRDQLLTICQCIAVNLKPGGRFVVINNNLELSPAFYDRAKKYGRRQHLTAPLQEGSPITVTLFNETQETTFVDYYLSKDTYEWAFQQAGLGKIRWHWPSISPADLQKFGQEFWQEFLDYPTFVIMSSH